jgi:hypothetical protein
MNAKVSAKGRTKAGEVLRVVGVAAALLVGSSTVFAESHGGGFGGGHSSGAHFSAPHMGVSHATAGGHYSAAPHYSGGSAYGYGRGYASGYGYGVRGGYGYRAAWGGGYWHGAFWPGAYYGWSYPLFLGFLPAVYATYWWGGIPYYYVNNVYYTWNPADNGYVAADPPPVGDAGYADDVNAADAAGPNAGNAADNTPPDAAQGPQGAQGPGAPYLGIMAYPRNGQSEQQQSTDKFQCHTWAKGQAGFDPTSQASANASASARSAYGRAMSACLDARGYTVR